MAHKRPLEDAEENSLLPDCAVCREKMLTGAMMLTCGHSICEPCENQLKEPRCPICKAVLRAKNKKNKLLQDLLMMYIPEKEQASLLLRAKEQEEARSSLQWWYCNRQQLLVARCLYISGQQPYWDATALLGFACGGFTCHYDEMALALAVSYTENIKGNGIIARQSYTTELYPEEERTALSLVFGAPPDPMNVDHVKRALFITHVCSGLHMDTEPYVKCITPAIFTQEKRADVRQISRALEYKVVRIAQQLKPLEEPPASCVNGDGDGDSSEDE